MTKPIIIGVFLVGLIALIFAVRGANNEAATEISTADREQGSPVAGDDDHIEDSIELNIDVNRLDSESQTEIPPHVVAEYEAWKTSRGFTTEYNMFFNQVDYLKELASNGDALASQTLGYMTLGTEEGNKYLEDAVVRGSIQSLHFLSAAAELVADGRHKALRATERSPMDQHEFGVKALEYLLVAELRGDTFAAANSIAQLQRRLSYTAQDIAQACAQAPATYDRFESRRLALGLPSFDNSPLPTHQEATAYDRLCLDSQQ